MSSHYSFATQIIDPERGHTDWVTTPPVRDAQPALYGYNDDPDPDELAEAIHRQRKVAFLSSMRGRVAVWRRPVETLPFGDDMPPPDGTYEATR